MSHSLSSSLSTAPPSLTSSPQDFTTLASALQEATHALLAYSEHCGIVQAKQPPDSQKPSASIPSRSKKAKRKEKCQASAFDRYAPDAFNDFAGKELAKSFDEAYANGNFRDEIRYYYVPSYVVKYEHRLLHYHQQNSVLDMLLGVHTELDIRSNLLAYLTEETNLQGHLSLAQVHESLLQPLRLLQTIHSHLNNFILIHKAMLPHTQKR